MSEEIRIGSHLFRHEPPDLLLWKLAGDISEAQMRRLCDETAAVAAGKDYLLMLVDLSSVGTISPGARKAIVEEKRAQQVTGTGIVGASHHLRIIANFVIRAAALVQSDTHNPVRFFQTEAEARDWLAERRRAVLQAHR
jgi:hypothetical protein